MTDTTAIGRQGEQAVVFWLQNQGFDVLAQNWRTRWCEIDIIATKNQVVYFVEVKYRKNDHFGAGFDYITAKKRSQMQFAAELWLQQHHYSGECQLAAASVDGSTGTVSFIDDL